MATPWRTPSRSLITNNAILTWYVRNDGYYNCNNASNSYGVRPALTLNPSLLVSIEGGEDDEQSINLSEVPMCDLLAEVQRKYDEMLEREDG